MDRAEFSKRTAIAVSIALVPVLLWYFRLVLLIVVGAVLVAILLDLLSRPLSRLKLSRPLSVGLTLFLLLGVLAAAGYLFGTTVSAEMEDVLTRADTAARALADALGQSRWGSLLLSHIDSGQLSLTSWVSNVASLSTQLFASLLVTVAAGAYLAAQPGLYRAELHRFFPRRWADRGEAVAGHIIQSLELWMMGQGIQMLVVAVFTAGAVWLIGLPSPLALGVIAGLAEFIPYAGPFIAAVPALLVATAQGWSPLLWTILAYIVIQQLEGNVLVPIVQRRLVSIPPAIMLLSIVAVASFFGTAGVVFAAPISVMIFAAAEVWAGSRNGEAQM